MKSDSKRFVAILILAGSLAGQALAGIITVCPTNGCDYTSLTAALAAVVEGDIVQVAPGLYSVTNGESFPLIVAQAITLETTTPGARPQIKGDKTNTVLLITVPGVTVRGLRITDGRGSEGIYGLDGGGVCIFVEASTEGLVLLDDCVIENNACGSDATSDGAGGGVYCGGTWCTCFEVGITNSVIRSNAVPGNGGGVFCGLLSKVWVENSLVQSNKAGADGGGLYLDSYALGALKATFIRDNLAQGTSSQGGNGGGLFCNPQSACVLTECEVVANMATNYGGGLFTMSAVTNATGCGSADAPGPGSGRSLLAPGSLANVVANSLVASNSAGKSGGGVYVRENAILSLQGSRSCWNNAQQYGGGLFVAGGGHVQLAGGCLVEGNECVWSGGGVFLSTNSSGVFRDTRFVGNAAGNWGGAVLCYYRSSGAFSNCLVACNNAARAFGGGFSLWPQASASLSHCSLVGNFAPYGRSGLHFTNAAATITDSILWRNAGGSIETNNGTVSLSFCLDEDGADPPQHVIAGSPGYVGWDTNSIIFVDASAPTPGDGTADHPYDSLQAALGGFDFRLGLGSPCLGSASDGGNLGAESGMGGVSGNVAATIRLADGGYDLRGRNVIFASGLEGAGASNTILTNTLFGYIEAGFIRDLAITGERIYGGAVLRGDATLERCRVYSNRAVKDGAGIFVCDRNRVTLASTTVDLNTSLGKGGGLFLGSDAWAALRDTLVQKNISADQGGGIYAVSSDLLTLTNSAVVQNITSNLGGGLRLGGTAFIQSSQVLSNRSNGDGGGVYVSGRLTVADSIIRSNRADHLTYAASLPNRGGGLYVTNGADVLIQSSLISSNYADENGSALLCGGRTRLSGCAILGNYSAGNSAGNYGGAVSAEFPNSPACESCQFIGNICPLYAGAVLSSSSPSFLNCLFGSNNARYGAAAYCYNGSRAVFEGCSFTNNAAIQDGGAVYSTGSTNLFLRCDASNCSARSGQGGTVRLDRDSSRFVACPMTRSSAGGSGGAVFLAGGGSPLFQQVSLTACQASAYGGGLASGSQVSPAYEDLIVSNCTALLGGGLFVEGGSNVFARCKFLNNTAASSLFSADGGGAMLTSNTVASFIGCWFASNQADDDGGGFAVSGTARVSLTNSFVVGNRCPSSGAGAYFTSSSSGAFQNCVLLNNIAEPGNGGALFVDDACLITNDSSIVYFNSPDGIAHRASNPNVRYCCVQEAWPGPGNFTNNPRLDPLTFALQDGSPCLDAGNPAPELNDSCLPPGQGTSRNDVGVFGGPGNCSAQGLLAVCWIPANLVWKFSDQGPQPADDWRAAGFDDTAWDSGPAKLGYGRDGEVTTLSRNGVTSYFRRAFNVTEAGRVTQLQARLARNDGAVVYLNGAEIFRDNMPAGLVTPSTLAVTNVPKGAAANRWFTNSVPAELLLDGLNLLAAEVHLSASTNADLGFNFELFTPPSLARPALTAQSRASESSLGLSCLTQFGQGYTLECSTNLTDWTALASWIGTGGAWAWTNPAPTASTKLFYRLRSP